MRLLVLNGPNINIVGIRETNIYGNISYIDLLDKIDALAKENNVEVIVKQSNFEGELVSYIQEAYFDNVDGIIINPGAYTHTSIAILDALKSSNIPTIEVHISDVDNREDFRKISYVFKFAFKRICGHGLDGYLEAIQYFIDNFSILRISKGKAKGTLKAPSSKSYAHRELIAAALAGNSRVFNISYSDDINATLDSLKALGFNFIKDASSVKFLDYNPRREVLNARESGSTLRFLIPLMLVKNKGGRITGTTKLFSRGLSVYQEIFDKQNIKYEIGKNYIDLSGELSSGTYNLDADISSQFISGLLFALPLLKGNSVIRLNKQIESKSYIDLTIDTLNKFGINVSFKDNEIFIEGNHKYLCRDISVEGDYSNAAFFEAFNVLGDEVTIEGLNENSLQGDMAYLELFKELKKSSPEIDLSNCIDLGPILFVLAALNNGAKFTNIRRLRIKESDRVKEMLDILALFGAKYIENDNEVEIFKANLHKVDDVIFLPNDHRIVMAITVLLTRFEGRIANYSAVKKSFPHFFNELKKLSIEVNYETK